ncbi:MAG: hypothetical protein CMJ35_14575 [Phycisphaerae bacterium]|nr:hypothetical protein [Phycisphaerae bacterium]MBM92814.1 hypothetical protein [Phycisphaerae bacterium]HCT45098.1 hypothetical protein [Phycisphaerales bacterium]|tara:strand:- start:207 stop:599 length:393 start_codon:yes stop_codon:yes gene_type:complete
MGDNAPAIKACQVCGYDMSDRHGGDPCPECGSPLDTRPDDDRYIQAGHLGKVLLCCAIVIQVFLPPVAILLVIGAAILLARRHDARQYRLSYRARRDRKHANYLAYIWIGVFVATIVFSSLWPNWHFWLD